MAEGLILSTMVSFIHIHPPISDDPSSFSLYCLLIHPLIGNQLFYPKHRAWDVLENVTVGFGVGPVLTIVMGAFVN